MKNLSALFIILLLIILCNPSFSKGINDISKVSGTVTDSNNNPIERVSVYIPELKITVATDSKGRFSLSNLPAGLFEIEFSHFGYKTKVKSVEIINKEINLEVTLNTSEIRTDEIVVSAPYAALPEKTPYEITALPADEMNYSGAETLTEAITHLPGISQLSTGVGITKPVIRGLHGNRILTVIDGFRFDNQQWQDEHGLGLSGMGLSSVEVLKGPASVLYGGDAMSGVLNLVDEKPAPVGSFISDANVRIDENTLGLNTDVGIKSSRESYYWKVRVGGESHADYLDGENERVPNTRFNGFNLKANYGLISSDLVSDFNYHFSYYQFGVVEQDEGMKKESEEEERFGREMEEAYHGVNYHLITTQNTYFLGDSRIKFDAGAHFNNRLEQEGPEEQALGNLDMQLNTYSLNLRYVSPNFYNSEITAGVHGTAQSNSNSGSRVIIPDATTSEISGFAFARHEFDKLVIEEGIRLNSYNLKTEKRGTPGTPGYMPVIDETYTPFNGSFGLTYSLFDNFLIKGNFSTGYRAPNLAELSSNGLHEGTLNYEIGDANLKAEQNSELDLGIHYYSELVSVDLSVFNDDFSNYIYLSPTSETIGGYKVYRFLQSDATLKGGEVSINWKPGHGSRLSFRNTFSALEAKRSDDSYLPLMPSNKMSNEVKYNTDIWNILTGGYMKLEVVTSFEQSNIAAEENITPSYNLVNLELGGYILGGDLYGTLAVTNLLGEVYYDHLSRIKPGSFNDPDVGFNNLGRNFTIALHIPILDSTDY